MRRKLADTKVIPVSWYIITVPAITPGEIRTNIEFKIPRYFRECYGIMFSATKNGLDSRANIIGNITLHTNSKKSNPVQLPVRVKPLADQGGTITAFRKKFDVYHLEETMKAGMKIQAEFKDTSAIPNLVSYDLKIYLKGLRINENR